MPFKTPSDKEVLRSVLAQLAGDEIANAETAAIEMLGCTVDFSYVQPPRVPTPGEELVEKVLDRAIELGVAVSIRVSQSGETVTVDGVYLQPKIWAPTPLEGNPRDWTFYRTDLGERTPNPWPRPI